MASYEIRCPSCGSERVSIHIWTESWDRYRPRVQELAGGVRVIEVGKLEERGEPEDLGEVRVVCESCGHTAEHVGDPAWVAAVP